MAIERRLTELIGPLGGKLHTARSRNDQVATDLSLLVRAHAARAIALLESLMETLVAQAEAHRDWPAPSYTHLQRAQPVYLGHHLLAYFWMFQRDARRFFRAAEATTDMPAGSGRSGRAQLGRSTATPSPPTSASSGPIPTPSTPSPTGTSPSTTSRPPRSARCTSRGSAPRSCSGRARSSASASCPTRSPRARASCPRRRTPTPPSCCAARRRGSPPRSRACSARCTPCRSPTARTSRRTRSRSSTRSTTWSSAWRRPPGCSPGSASTASASRRRPEDEMLAATDLADALVQEGVPFREAHGLVGGLVRAAVDSGRPLSELDRHRARRRSRGRQAGGPPCARVRPDDRVEGLGGRHRVRPAGRADSSGRARRSPPCAREPRLLRPLRPRGRTRADRLRARASVRPRA